MYNGSLIDNCYIHVHPSVLSKKCSMDDYNYTTMMAKCSMDDCNYTAMIAKCSMGDCNYTAMIAKCSMGDCNYTSMMAVSKFFLPSPQSRGNKGVSVSHGRGLKLSSNSRMNVGIVN